jgi:dTDP-4-dehydrorhamnose reductase
VNDQVGSPTYAKDLAEAVLQMISSGKAHYGVYHFSNEGSVSWYEFAEEIKRIAGLGCNVHPISSSEFPTPAKRPFYSVLSKERIISDYGIQLKNWKESLYDCLEQIKKAAQ